MKMYDRAYNRYSNEDIQYIDMPGTINDWQKQRVRHLVSAYSQQNARNEATFHSVPILRADRCGQEAERVSSERIVLAKRGTTKPRRSDNVINGAKRFSPNPPFRGVMPARNVFILTHRTTTVIASMLSSMSWNVASGTSRAPTSL